jgi:hypothetical protein
VCATTATTGTTRAIDEVDNLLQAHSLHKVLRIGAWMKRFVDNCREARTNRRCGPLTTSEIASQRKWWIVRAQRDETSSDEFKHDQVNLNLKPNNDGILECRGRIEGEFPIYLRTPKPSIYSQIGWASSLDDIAWWCGNDYGKSKGSLLDLEVEAASQASSIGVLGMQKIPSSSLQ